MMGRKGPGRSADPRAGEKATDLAQRPEGRHAKVDRQSARLFSLSDAKLRRSYSAWQQEIRQYQELEVSVDEADGVVWAYMSPKDRPSVTPVMAKESLHLQRSIQALHGELGAAENWPFRYLVWGSRVPSVFNLGGDLRLFAQLIREENRAALTDYATNCIDVVFNNFISLDLPLVTVSLVEGDALGGGFEAAVSSDLVIAERSAKFGLPEVLFNLFPGMGAYSIIARRINPKAAERMILSGRVYSADELYDLGLIDMVVDDGQGHEALFDYTQHNLARQGSHLSVYRAGRMINPLTRQELLDIAILWVDRAMELTEPDLKKMERLAAAQDRRRRLSKPQT